MFDATNYTGSISEQHQLVLDQLVALCSDESNLIANLSNASALLNFFLTDINWVGFYLMDEPAQQLVLGPFQGLPACVRIPLGRGVCGTAASKLEIQRVDDVQQFFGHIACDSQTRSEIVLPLVKDHQLLGVLDIDSPQLARFSKEDEQFLSRFVDKLIEYM